MCVSDYVGYPLNPFIVYSVHSDLREGLHDKGMVNFRDFQEKCEKSARNAEK